MITKEYLHKIFRYDCETGKLYWKISKAKRIKIDDEAGGIDWKGYRVVRIDTKSYKVHRLIWIINYGDIPNNLQIDHINGIRDDNHLENLRLVTNKENKRNISLPINNTSGYLGVYFNKISNKWVSQIKVNQKVISLGTFSNKQDAIKVRKEAEEKYNFHKNHGRV